MSEDGDTGSDEQTAFDGPSVNEITDDELFNIINSYSEEIADIRDRTLLYLLYPSEGYVGVPDAVGVYNIFRNNGRVDDLDIILQSPGGDIHEAYDIIKICREYTDGRVTAFVPMSAMSAATIIAIGADKIVLSPIGQLGPLDPQVPHPSRNERIPIRAITEMPDVLESALETDSTNVSEDVKGEAIIKPIAEQIDPYYLTQHMNTNELAMEYGQKVLSKRGVSTRNAERCIQFLTDPPASHSYRVDLDEIESTHSLSNALDAESVQSIDNGFSIENKMMKLLEIFLYWDLSGLHSDSPRTETKVELINPPEGKEQQELDDVPEQKD